jgi:hypothetical protein
MRLYKELYGRFLKMRVKKTAKAHKKPAKNGGFD